MNTSMLGIIAALGSISACTTQAEGSGIAAMGLAEPGEYRTSELRVTFRAGKSDRGNTIPISEGVIINLCGDHDGCALRMGMYDWDNLGRVASRDNLFFYNPYNRAWRAMDGDPSGTNVNAATEHVMNSWACYFTDGAYLNWANLGDTNPNFGLLSWNEYNAECWLTIID